MKGGICSLLELGHFQSPLGIGAPVLGLSDLVWILHYWLPLEMRPDYEGESGMQPWIPVAPGEEP